MDNIDSSCRNNQLAVIYKLLMSDYRELPNKASAAYLPLWAKLNSLCGIGGKMAIFFALHLPKHVLNNYYIKLFNDKIIPRII